MPQELIGQLRGNNNGRPDGLDVFKGLDAAIREHAKATDNLATSIKAHGGDTVTLSKSVDGFSNSLLLVGAVCLIIGAVFGYLVGTAKRPQA